MVENKSTLIMYSNEKRSFPTTPVHTIYSDNRICVGRTHDIYNSSRPAFAHTWCLFVILFCVYNIVPRSVFMRRPLGQLTNCVNHIITNNYYVIYTFFLSRTV